MIRIIKYVLAVTVCSGIATIFVRPFLSGGDSSISSVLFFTVFSIVLGLTLFIRVAISEYNKKNK